MNVFGPSTTARTPVEAPGATWPPAATGSRIAICAHAALAPDGPAAPVESLAALVHGVVPQPVVDRDEPRDHRCTFEPSRPAGMQVRRSVPGDMTRTPQVLGAVTSPDHRFHGWEGGLEIPLDFGADLLDGIVQGPVKILALIEIVGRHAAGHLLDSADQRSTNLGVRL